MLWKDAKFLIYKGMTPGAIKGMFSGPRDSGNLNGLLDSAAIHTPAKTVQTKSKTTED